MRAADLDRRLDLPPLFRGVTLREGEDAFAHAVAIAPEAGAGTLVLSRGSLVFDCAVVLEPAMPLARARIALAVGLTALADALAVIAPPEHPIGFRWPDTVLIDGARVGGARLAHAPVAGDLKAGDLKAGDLQAPDWIVLGAMLRLAEPAGIETGAFPGRTSLEQQGFEEVDGARLAERYARHLMAGLYTWQEEGFAQVAETWLSRLAEPEAPERGLDPSGDLLLRDEAGAETRRRLAPALASPTWLDLFP
jgi:biotin-(acetyl-CoA carboxylase) ligase